MDAFSTELLHALVEEGASLAELHISAVSERKHRVLQAVEPGRGAVLEPLPELLSIVGHFPVAVGAGHDADPARFRQISRGECVQPKSLGFKPARTRLAGKLFGKPFRAPGLRTPKEKQRAAGDRGGKIS